MTDHSSSLAAAEAAAGAFFRALEAGAWSRATSMMLPAVIEQNAEAIRRRLGEEEAEPERSSSETEGGERLISAEEYNRLASGGRTWWELEFPAGASRDDLLAMSNEALVEAYIRGRLAPSLIGAIDLEWRVLGVVADTSVEAVALFRAREGIYRGEADQPVQVSSRIEMLPMLSSADRWWVGSVQGVVSWGVAGWWQSARGSAGP